MPGSFEEFGLGIRKIGRRGFRRTARRAGVKIASTGVITQSRPELQHFFEPYRGKIRHLGQRVEEATHNRPTAFTVVCCSMISDSQTW